MICMEVIVNKFPDEVILQARKSQDIEFISDQIELEDSLPEEYLQTVEMGERSISIIYNIIISC